MTLRVITLSLTVAMTLSLTLTLAEYSEGQQKGDNFQVLFEEINQLKEQLSARHKRSDDLGSIEVVTSTLTQKVTSLEADLTATKAELAATKAQLSTVQNQQKSTYIRWGRSQCPSNANLVYNGVVGSSKYTEQGGGTNRLCLTHSPQFDTAAPLGGVSSLIHGTEWYVPGHAYTDVPCAVCSAPLPTTLMIPGTKTCPPGWTPQYTGHITATYTGYPTQSEFLCADDNPEDREGTGAAANDGSFFEYSVAACGTLPCPPYVGGQVVTCVVCSK